MKKIGMVILFCQGIICAAGVVHESFETLEAEQRQVDERISALSSEIKQLAERKKVLQDQRLQLQAKLILK